MIRVVINHDLIGIPEPVGDIRIIVREDAKVETSEPEAVRTSAFETKNMARPEATREPAVFPGMIQVKAGVIAARVVAHPLTVGMHVWSVWMAFDIAVIALVGAVLLLTPALLFHLALLRRPLLILRLLPMRWFGVARRRSRAARWNISTTDVALTPPILAVLLVAPPLR